MDTPILQSLPENLISLKELAQQNIRKKSMLGKLVIIDQGKAQSDFNCRSASDLIIDVRANGIVIDLQSIKTKFEDFIAKIPSVVFGPPASELEPQKIHFYQESPPAYKFQFLFLDQICSGEINEAQSHKISDLEKNSNLTPMEVKQLKFYAREQAIESAVKESLASLPEITRLNIQKITKANSKTPLALAMDAKTLIDDFFDLQKIKNEKQQNLVFSSQGTAKRIITISDDGAVHLESSFQPWNLLDVTVTFIFNVDSNDDPQPALQLENVRFEGKDAAFYQALMLGQDDNAMRLCPHHLENYTCSHATGFHFNLPSLKQTDQNPAVQNSDHLPIMVSEDNEDDMVYQDHKMIFWNVCAAGAPNACNEQETDDEKLARYHRTIQQLIVLMQKEDGAEIIALQEVGKTNEYFFLNLQEAIKEKGLPWKINYGAGDGINADGYRQDGWGILTLYKTPHYEEISSVPLINVGGQKLTLRDKDTNEEIIVINVHKPHRDLPVHTEAQIEALSREPDLLGKKVYFVGDWNTRIAPIGIVPIDSAQHKFLKHRIIITGTVPSNLSFPCRKYNEYHQGADFTDALFFSPAGSSEIQQLKLLSLNPRTWQRDDIAGKNNMGLFQGYLTTVQWEELCRFRVIACIDTQERQKKIPKLNQTVFEYQTELQTRFRNPDILVRPMANGINARKPLGIIFPKAFFDTHVAEVVTQNSTIALTTPVYYFSNISHVVCYPADNKHLDKFVACVNTISIDVSNNDLTSSEVSTTENKTRLSAGVIIPGVLGIGGLVVESIILGVGYSSFMTPALLPIGEFLLQGLQIFGLSDAAATPELAMILGTALLLSIPTLLILIAIQQWATTAPTDKIENKREDADPTITDEITHEEKPKKALFSGQNPGPLTQPVKINQGMNKQDEKQPTHTKPQGYV